MTSLHRHSRRHYARFYHLAMMAVTVMTAVVTGSLILGDSVRGTLIDRVKERLGDTRTIISPGQGFLCDSILREPLLRSAQGCLVTEGFVYDKGRMIPVTVWGTDKDIDSSRQCLLNHPLQKQLGNTQKIVLHLPAGQMVPSGSLFVSQQYTTQLRLDVAGCLTAGQGGNRLLRDEQIRPMNVFMQRRELAEAMGLDNRINMILSPEDITEAAFEEIWTPACSGIRQQGSIITSERVLLPAVLVGALQPRNRYFAYFVNNLGDIPYSFVTATDALQGDETILSDYAARRLHAGLGDSVEMEYYVVKGLKKLETRRHRFIVKQVVPLKKFQSSPWLSADFPGLSNVSNCTDWDSDLPIDMTHITNEDEDYWEAHRQTPKALVSYQAVADDWGNAWGVATALNSPLEADKVLRPQMLGISLSSPRAAALEAARNGTDFASLFLALGFFIILSASLLIINPLIEMFQLRHAETELYGVLGFSQRKLRKYRIREAAPLLMAATPLGVAAGYVYAALSLLLLSTAWSGATQTQGFGLHFNLLSLLLGWLASMLIVWLLCLLAVRKGMAQPRTCPTRRGTRGKSIFAWGCLCLTIVLIGLNFLLYKNMILFILCGMGWILSAGLLGQEWIRYKNRQAKAGRLDCRSLIWHSLQTRRPLHLLSYWTLSTGIFTIFAVGLNRPDFNRASPQSTGGYQMFHQVGVPLQYDLNQPLVRRRMGLDFLPEGQQILQLKKHLVQEAGCMNLNKAQTPSVIAMDPADMPGFGIDTSMFDKASDQTPAVVIDQETLLWSLMKSPGDSLRYLSDQGDSVSVLIVGTYPGGIFHGNALMPRDDFQSLWPTETGSRILLSNTEPYTDLMATALSDYGLEITTTAERLRHFHEVTDTYLSIFLSLGGLGLLLGIFSLMIVIRKNLAARAKELETLHVLGYPDKNLVHMLRSENCLVSIYALVAGAVGSLISISASLTGPDAGVWLMAAFVLLLLLGCIIYSIIHIINPKSLKL